MDKIEHEHKVTCGLQIVNLKGNFTMSETMEERENHHVAEHIQKMVYERMRVIAVKHGGAPESLFVHEAWREVIADMAQRELTPWEYIHTTP